MAKTVKREVCLIDDTGAEWVRATLSPSAVKRIVKEYLRQGVWLKELTA